jgi:hypothetical protein
MCGLISGVRLLSCGLLCMPNCPLAGNRDAKMKTTSSEMWQQRLSLICEDSHACCLHVHSERETSMAQPPSQPSHDDYNADTPSHQIYNDGESHVTNFGEEVSFATVEEKKRKWWRNALVNLAFIASWCVSRFHSTYNSLLTQILLHFKTSGSSSQHYFHYITNGCSHQTIMASPFHSWSQHYTCLCNLGWRPSQGLYGLTNLRLKTP